MIDRQPMHSNSYGSRGINQDWQPDFFEFVQAQTVIFKYSDIPKKITGL